MLMRSIRFALLVSLGLFLAAPAGADDLQKRVAIVDASVDTRPYLDTLEAAGVKVIGRYLSRCHQDFVKEKRLIDNADEIDKILSHKGKFAAFSIYQYFSGSKYKFLGKREIECPKDSGKTIVISLADEQCVERKVSNCQQEPGPDHDGKAEAEWDGNAAVKQAREILRQPPGSAIYFGVDFDHDSANESALIDYFTIVSNKLREAGYLVGAYGNGAALTLLRDKKIKEGKFAGMELADLTWFNASPGHEGSAKLYNTGDWDLFQSRIAVRYPANASTDIVVDLDIQNKARADKYIGFWNRDEKTKGLYEVPKDRTEAIYNARRFVCNGQALLRTDARADAPLALGEYCGRRTDQDVKITDCDRLKTPDERPRICFAHPTRVGASKNGFIEVDCSETGDLKLWTRTENLSTTFDTRPYWEADTAKRRALKREDTECK